MLKRKVFAFILVGILLLTSAVPAFATGGGPIDPNSVVTISQPQFLPRSLSNAPVDVVLHLKGNSTAEVQATLGRKLTAGEDDAISKSLKANQDALKGAIQRAGGDVIDQFQHAINGIRVRIAGDKLAQLATLPNVVEILPVQTYTIDNATSVPYIGAPLVWNTSPSPDLHGEGIKVGIIDTGIDYTHANFGGPGTAAAYTTAHAASTSPADPSLFGPGAPKVKGGFDFVGDAYNAANPASVPQPDPNPLDCNGHGSHVAGTVAGFGVTAAGATYTGPYNSSIYTPGAFRIGPGVAPKADLYAYRVFGCTGSTNVVVEAIDRAVQDGMDVINMSLGSPFGTDRTADAVASDNAAHAGIIVVTSAGNAGPNPYIVGSPSTADGAISVAANDPHASFPGATITLSTGGASITAINANGAIFADGTTYNILTLVDNPATPVDESLGCNLSDYPSTPLPANTIAVVVRGVCARVAKAIVGQQAGAAAVLMVNNSTDLPPFEGLITSNPDTGQPYTVTIPFFGVRGLASTSTSDGARVRADNGGTLTVTNATIPNPSFSAVANFSSGGPRNGDSFLKPEVTAPGVSIYSTAVGTGNQGEFLSGTSMAAPHVTGVAALVKQAHPDWKEDALKAAIVDTANPEAIAGFKARLAGAGLVQPYPAVLTSVTAAGGSQGVIALNFGFDELNHDLSQSGGIDVSNHSSESVTFDVSVTNQTGVPHTLTPASGSVTIPGNSDKELEFTLNVPAATAGNSNGFFDAAGIITLTPTGGGNNGVALHVPYYLVPRPLSALAAIASRNRLSTAVPSTTVAVSNKLNAPIAGNADFYAWGIHSNFAPHQTANNVRDVGVQAFQGIGGANGPLIVFGVNTYQRWSTPSTYEFDIYVDVDPQNHNGDDYIVVGVDYGVITTGSFTGQYGTFVFSTRSSGASALNPANTFAPTDSSTAVLAILRSQLCRTNQPCLSSTNPRFTYHIVAFDLFNNLTDNVIGVGAFNAFSPAITTGAYLAGIAPGASATTTLTINPAEWAQTPALGALILTTENKSGADEAQEVPLTFTK